MNWVLRLLKAPFSAVLYAVFYVATAAVCLAVFSRDRNVWLDQNNAEREMSNRPVSSAKRDCADETPPKGASAPL